MGADQKLVIKRYTNPRSVYFTLTVDYEISRCSLASVALRPVLCIHGLAAAAAAAAAAALSPGYDDTGMPVGGIGGGAGAASADDVIGSRDSVTSSAAGVVFPTSPAQSVERRIQSIRTAVRDRTV